MRTQLAAIAFVAALAASREAAAQLSGLPRGPQGLMPQPEREPEPAGEPDSRPLRAAGLITFALGHAVTVPIALLMVTSPLNATNPEAALTFVPIAGPFIGAAVLLGGAQGGHVPAMLLLVLGGAQVLGASLFVADLVTHRDPAARPLPAARAARWGVGPASAGWGLSFTLATM